MNYSDPLARRLVTDTFSVNSARFAELSRLDEVMYQFATVDVYYTPWGPSLAGGRSYDGPASSRLGRGIERLRQIFADRHEQNEILLRDGFYDLHLEDLQVVLESAVELGAAEVVCEVIETCRAQGYSAVPLREPVLAGDKVDSLPNRALAAIGIATVGLPPDIAVRKASVLRQLSEQTIDVDLLRRSIAGPDSWWLSLLQCGEIVYWSVLTPADPYCGKYTADTEGGIESMPSAIIAELTRRRRLDEPPLSLVISAGSGTGAYRLGNGAGR